MVEFLMSSAHTGVVIKLARISFSIGMCGNWISPMISSIGTILSHNILLPVNIANSIMAFRSLFYLVRRTLICALCLLFLSCRLGGVDPDFHFFEWANFLNCILSWRVASFCALGPFPVPELSLTRDHFLNKPKLSYVGSLLVLSELVFNWTSRFLFFRSSDFFQIYILTTSSPS